MRPENEIPEEVRQLLDSIEEHGKNVRRQQRLIEAMETEKRKTENGERKTFHLFCWVLGTAAALLLLWLLAKPALKQTPDVNEEILVEETEGLDSVKIHENEALPEVKESVLTEEYLAEEKTIHPEKQSFKKTQPKSEQPKIIHQKKQKDTLEKAPEETLLAESTPTEPIDPVNLGSNSKPTQNESTTPQSPGRRVIRSLNLVCFECQTENGDRRTENFPLYLPSVGEGSRRSTLHSPLQFGQKQDPNMKNGSLAFEFKLP